MELLCSSRNAVDIVYETESSHVATHFSDTPELKAAVIEALAHTVVEGSEMIFEYHFNEPIGTTDLVETTGDDEIVFAKRKNRGIYTRFTKSQQSQSCSTVTVALNRLDDQRYQLWSAWIGYIGPPFPGDENETPDSRTYWSSHALVWGRQEIQPGTETVHSPW